MIGLFGVFTLYGQEVQGDLVIKNTLLFLACFYDGRVNGVRYWRNAVRTLIN